MVHSRVFLKIKVVELTTLALPIDLAGYIKQFRFVQNEERSVNEHLFLNRVHRSMGDTKFVRYSPQHQRTFAVMGIGSALTTLTLLIGLA